ncbi:MAG: ABC transporter ATP-binding protein [Elusimicrobiota bacterium]
MTDIPATKRSSPIVELRNVHMHFDVSGGRMLQAARDVGFRIDAGEILTMVGESGCGKSTVGKMALGVLRPSQGEVLFDGRSIWDRKFRMDRRTRCMVQVVHQDSYASLNPVRTVYQTLAAVLRFHGITKGRKDTEQRVLELLGSMGLNPPEYFVNKHPFQLSGGQRQRVSIVRATILEPKLIIADEPVSAVDVSLRLAIIDLMKRLNRDKGIAFLYITHDLATARYFAENGRIIVMYLGRMVETGVVGECIQRPAHPYLRALLSAIPSAGPAAGGTPKALPLKSVEMPNPLDPPSGCVFRPRCPYESGICSEKVPALRPVAGDGPGHRVACHNADKLPPRAA